MTKLKPSIIAKKIGLGFVLFLNLIGCSQSESSFAQYPGFKEYFAANKPSDALPNDADKALLRQYRPRIYLEEGQTPFINFYDDYIGNGSLYLDGKRLSNSVTQTLLNENKDQSNVEFRHHKNTHPTTPTLYGRISRAPLSYEGQSLELTFLRYNLVFATSGVPQGIALWQRAIIGLIGSNSDWHQLDHYVGLTICLEGTTPIAVMLQQHNYQTTWLLSDRVSETTLVMPSDNRIVVDVALQSNELYPHAAERVEHPGISWVNDKTIEFLKTGTNKPMMAGWDISHGEIEIDYSLEFLPPSDAFYTFKGKLGKKRSLPGRNGPPGADYVTLPELLPMPNQLVTGYRPRDVQTETNKLNALFSEESFAVKPAGIKAYQRDFLKDLKALVNQ